jgi:hypothetical protein
MFVVGLGAMFCRVRFYSLHLLLFLNGEQGPSPIFVKPSFSIAHQLEWNQENLFQIILAGAAEALPRRLPRHDHLCPCFPPAGNVGVMLQQTLR